ncbi:MAG: helicase-associated domain-containing protein, partial [Planctomycetes bacterium]|nr:helicase-associated domain-containing protein [Planctomycetota bacterium]
LQADPLLSQAPADSLAPLPDPSQFTMLLGSAIGVLGDSNGDLKAGEFPGSWREGLPKAVASIWSVLPVLENWNAVYALDAQHSPGNPYPSAHLLALLLLGRLPDGAFASPQAIERWIVERHPYWSAPTLDANGQPIAPARRSGKNAPTSQERGIARFILGIAHPLRLVQATRDPNGDWLVRLSPLGRWVLGLCDAPPMAAAFPQTVLVQPNLEILAYRQGLTPELIVQLSKFATWKGLGAACTMQLESHGVYRALELGETFDSIVQTLERHGMKSLPAAVLDSLRTWSNKRDRLSVYTAAALFEFASPAELNEALARGLPAVRLTDRLAVVSNEEAIDYRNFRLTATRDYCLPPEKCVDVEADGVTLSIDLARSDLLLESEVKAFAELAPLAPAPGRRLYLLTSASLQSARANGFSLANLESWFNQRTGLPVSPAAQLLFTAPDHPPAELRRQIVLHVMDAELADGLQQWPATRDLIQSRLGPTALVVAEKDVETLSLRCRELGLKLFHSEG